MSRIQALVRRYAAAASVARGGVEILLCVDPGGSALDKAVRGLVAAVREEEAGPWDELLGISRALRWRRLTQPQPLEFNPALTDGCRALLVQVERLRGAVLFEDSLDVLASAAEMLLAEDPPAGTLLERSIGEVGPSSCAVIVASRAAQASIRDWLGSSGVRVLVVGELDVADGASQIYVLGPPRFFPPSVMVAPPTEEVTFLLPEWFTDLSLPRSAVSSYAEGVLHVRARVTREGGESPAEEPGPSESAQEISEDELQPAPNWGPIRRPNRAPDLGEVEARKLLLAGDLAMWLDDGDRIRALDPRQPAGERVIYADVGEVGVGTFLLVRTGTTERRVLYEAALHQLGAGARAVDESQVGWKHALSERLGTHGYSRVVRTLRSLGVRTAERARAWTDPNLIRPNSDNDFESTLEWLGIPPEPTVTHANRLRRALYQASADIREELESAVSQADLDALERHGSLYLEVETVGFRGILATRVLAMSPATELIQRRDARLPFEDRSAQWLE